MSELAAAAERTTRGIKTTAKYRGLRKRRSIGGNRAKMATIRLRSRHNFEDDEKSFSRIAKKKGTGIRPMACKNVITLVTMDTSKNSTYFLVCSNITSEIV